MAYEASRSWSRGFCHAASISRGRHVEAATREAANCKSPQEIDMANRKVTLVRSARVPGSGWRRGTLIRAKNGRIKPDYMVYLGEQVHCPHGRYEIRYYEGRKSVHKPVGKDLDVAQAAFSLFEKKLQYEALQ